MPAGSRSSPGTRDTKATACPGQYLYARLSTIRSGTQNRLENRVKLELTGQGGSVASTGATLHVLWEYDGYPVNGTVRLQRRLSNGSWRSIRYIRVSDGHGTEVIAPRNTNWWRVRAVDARSSQVDTSHPNGTSTWHQLRTVGQNGRTILDLGGPKESLPRAGTPPCTSAG